MPTGGQAEVIASYIVDPSSQGFGTREGERQRDFAMIKQLRETMLEGPLGDIERIIEP